MMRSTGILMPISALNSKYGIGTFGKSAYEFADFLCDCGVRYWQILPLCPVGAANSPYMSSSSFAGNPFFIDLEMLIEDGLLTVEEVENAINEASDCEDANNKYSPLYNVSDSVNDSDNDFSLMRSCSGVSARIDYDVLYRSRPKLLRIAKERGFERDKDAVSLFIEENKSWIEDYALFMALRNHFDGLSWNAWPDEDLKFYRQDALKNARLIYKEEIDLQIYIQFLFYKQWALLRDYVHDRGIKIIGDLPIYVALNSADAWANQHFFQLDENGAPTCGAGVPPDCFSKDGQLWGNPLYDWDSMKEDGYGFWIRRIDGVRRLYDVIRLDHFRAFDEYFSIPFDAFSASFGEWKKGPGLPFLNIISSWFPGLQFIAEDLGIISDSVRELVRDSGFPGMKVLQFAFVPGEDSEYLPHNCTENSICYTGTHDNNTLCGWLLEMDCGTREYIMNYTGEHSSDIKTLCDAVIRSAMATNSRLFVVQLQDFLYEGSEGRINTPGTVGALNWSYRLKEGVLTKELTKKIYDMNVLYGRC